MELTSRELCEKLFKVSGWGETYLSYWYNDETDDLIAEYGSGAELIAPAYTLGYLLRKLPKTQLPKHVNELNQGWEIKLGWNYKNQYWYAGYSKDDKYFSWYYEADTPEDAAALLCIKLFEEGILTAPSPDKESNE